MRDDQRYEMIVVFEGCENNEEERKKENQSEKKWIKIQLQY